MRTPEEKALRLMELVNDSTFSYENAITWFKANYDLQNVDDMRQPLRKSIIKYVKLINGDADLSLLYKALEEEHETSDK